MAFIPLIAAGIGAAITVGKAVNDQKNADKQNRVAADEMQYSPWTHMKMGRMDTKTSDPFGTSATTVGPLGHTLDDYNKSQTPVAPSDEGTHDYQSQKTNPGPVMTGTGPATGGYGGAMSMGSADQPLAYKFTEGQSGPYNSGTPIYNLGGYQWMPGDEASKAMGGGNGAYGGYDASNGGAYWSPYRSNY